MQTSYDLIFLTEKSMGLFWVLVQQICFCGIKYIYESLLPKGQRARRILAVQVCLFIVFMAISFEQELGISCFSAMLRWGHRNFYPWSVRIMLCSAMILYDALLLLYAFRIYRIYRSGLAAIRPTLPADAALCFFTAALGAGYIAASIRTMTVHDIPMRFYMWIGRAFIQIANFFYVPLEINGAVLLFFFWRAVREDRRAHD